MYHLNSSMFTSLVTYNNKRSYNLIHSWYLFGPSLLYIYIYTHIGTYNNKCSYNLVAPDIYSVTFIYIGTRGREKDRVFNLFSTEETVQYRGPLASSATYTALWCNYRAVI